MKNINKIMRGVLILAILTCVVVFAASCDVIGGHKHNLKKVDSVDPSCTEAGCESYYTCDGCDKIFKDFGATVELEAPKTIDPTGHSIVGILGKAPTCSEAGVEDCFKCTDCDTLFSDAKGENKIDAPVAIDPISHDLVKTAAQDATCTEAGNIEFYTCKTCKSIFSDSEGNTQITPDQTVVAAKGHSLAKTEAADATCTEAGNSAYWTCSSCGKFYSDAEGKNEIALADTVIDAKGHNYGNSLVIEGAVNTYEPGESFNTANLSVKLDCADCDNSIAVTGYTISKTENLQPADTEIVISYVDGDKTYTATVKITVKHTHTTGELISAVEPTCTEKGAVAHYECTVCHEKFEDKEATKPLASIEVAAKGHSAVKTDAVESTCTVAGNNAYWTCSACGKVFSDEDCTEETTVDAEKLPVAEHDTEVKSDADGHWDDCKNCDYTSDKAAHEGFAYPGEVPTCNVCSATIGAEAGWDGWVEFRPGIVEVTKGVVTSASHVDVNGIMASRYVFGAANAGAESIIWTMSDKNAYKSGNYQVRIPTVGSEERYIYLYVSNDGDTAVSFRLYSENNGAKGGVDITLGAGESGWFKYSVHTGTTVGSNINIKLLSDLASETEVTMYGYFYLCEDEISNLHVLNQNELKLSYEVGEKFDISNILLASYIVINEDGDLLSDGGAELYYYASNYTISGLENGQVLTEGTYTVTVSFGGKSVELQVVVSSHEHVIELVPAKNATCTEDGNEAYYICNVNGCGQLFADAEGNSPIAAITTIPAGHIECAAIPGFKANCPRCGEEYGEVLNPDGWVHFAPGVVYSDYDEGISGTVDGSGYINYEIGNYEGNILATKFTFAAGTPANSATAFWNDQDLAHNIKVPVRQDGTRVIAVITNHGTDDLTFTFGQVNSSQDTGSGTVLVPAGKTAAVEFAITGGASQGNNGWIAVRNNVENETVVTVYGYFCVEDDIASLNIKSPANKLVFSAGDMFTAEGLRLAIASKVEGATANYGETEIYSNFTTNLDGYTFTAEDEGKKTVTVSFGGQSVTYEIEVLGHQHQIERVEGVDAVKCQKDGYEAYYRCTVDGCGCFFADEAAQNAISAPVAISAHGAATIANGKVVCADCLTHDLGENWVFYNVTTQVGGGTNVPGNKIEIATVDGVSGTMITIGAGTTAGNRFQLCMNGNDANRQTVIPNLGANAQDGDLRHVLVFYKNFGTEDITLDLQNDANGGNGLITVPAGGTAICEFDVHNVGGSNWFYLEVKNDVKADTQIFAYGYIYVNDGEVSEISANTSACALTFKVGDTFSAAGLVVNAYIPSSTPKTVYVTTGYTTDLDGKVFTADDIGEQTVTVTFAGVTTTYTITVTE